jgi:NAD(P)-dependent dehydrogenase (short-subunit alcohol dehydrogenase family)
MINLKGKKILVTGASSGIGKGIAILLSELGADLIITGRNHTKLLDTHKLLQTNNNLIIVADITIDEEIDKIADQIEGVDGIVFCAGVIDYQPVKFLTREKIRQIFNINFESHVLLTQKMLKKKKINKQSSLVYISSLSSKLGVGGTSLYASSKAALSAFARVLAVELAVKKIRVNAISPGIIKTPMFETEDLSISKDLIDEAEKNYPLGYGRVEDVASYVAFLLSDSSTWITGTDHILDGGFTLN